MTGAVTGGAARARLVDLVASAARAASRRGAALVVALASGCPASVCELAASATPAAASEGPDGAPLLASDTFYDVTLFAYDAGNGGFVAHEREAPASLRLFLGADVAVAVVDEAGDELPLPPASREESCEAIASSQRLELAAGRHTIELGPAAAASVGLLLVVGE